MATLSGIARPYAEAVFALAREERNFEAWSVFLARAAYVVQEPQVARLLHDPRVGQRALTGLIEDLSRESLGKRAGHTLQLLAANGRLAALPAIAGHYEQLRADAEGTIEAVVTAAFALSDEQQAAIAGALSANLKRKVHLAVAVDPELIGGAVVRAGDLVIDASVRGHLQKLSVALSQ